MRAKDRLARNPQVIADHPILDDFAHDLLRALAGPIPDEVVLHIGAHRLSDKLPSDGRVLIGFQTEQMFDANGQKLWRAFPRRQIESLVARHDIVLDLSAANAPAYAFLPEPARRKLRFGPHIFPSLPPAPQPDRTGALVFVGGLNPRREQLLGETAFAAPVTKVPQGTFGAALDEVLQTSLGILNLHVQDGVYTEYPRLLKALLNGKVLWSESLAPPFLPGRHYFPPDAHPSAEAIEAAFRQMAADLCENHSLGNFLRRAVEEAGRRPAPAPPSPAARDDDDEAFVDRSVALQIGDFRGPVAQAEDALVRALRGSSAGTVALRPGEKNPLVLDKAGTLMTRPLSGLGRKEKTAVSLSQISACHPDFAFAVDMQDRRVRSTADPEQAAFPVFCFNRVVGDGQRILWPLPVYHDLENSHFLGGVTADTVPWADKKPQVVWRGGPRGRVAAGASIRDEGIRFKTALRHHLAGKMTEVEFAAACAALPRFNAVSRAAGDPRFDFGFVDDSDHVIAEIPLHAELERARMSPGEMQNYRYIAVLRGVDVGSNFYWVMNSGSVGFVMDTPFETFASGHFRPWEHYIPFREDCADLVERFDWAENHPEECQAMVARAAEICGFLARPDLRVEIQRRVVGTVASMPRV